MDLPFTTNTTMNTVDYTDDMFTVVVYDEDAEEVVGLEFFHGLKEALSYTLRDIEGFCESCASEELWHAAIRSSDGGDDITLQSIKIPNLDEIDSQNGYQTYYVHYYGNDRVWHVINTQAEGNRYKNHGQQS